MGFSGRQSSFYQVVEHRLKSDATNKADRYTDASSKLGDEHLFKML